MKVITTPEEDRFLAAAAKDYYQVAIAVETFQKTVFKSLREITDEFDSALVRLGLPFANARERAGISPYPYIQRKLSQQHLEAGIGLQWLEDNPDFNGKRLCVYCWIWLKHRERRDTLDMRIKTATAKPYEAKFIDGSSCISLYFSFAQSAQIKANARKCTTAFVRVLNGCRKLLSDPAIATK
jgi:hypothetical protein